MCCHCAVPNGHGWRFGSDPDDHEAYHPPSRSRLTAKVARLENRNVRMGKGERPPILVTHIIDEDHT